MNDANTLEILKFTAEGIVKDAMFSPALLNHLPLFMFGDIDASSAVDHITKLLCRYYENSELVVFTQCLGSTGEWASTAVVLKTADSAYVIQLYTKDCYRGNGLATRTLADIMLEYANVSLTCRNDLVPFYEKLGFRNLGTCGSGRADNKIASGTSKFLTMMHCGDGDAWLFTLKDCDFKFTLNGNVVNLLAGEKL